LRAFKINDLHIFLFILYYAAAVYFIMNSSYFKASHISKSILITLFTIKIIVGFAYAYYFALPIHIKSSDTWEYFKESLIETDKLLQQPKLFFSELWYNQYATNGGFFTGVNSFWNDLKMTVFVKLIALLNLFSFKNYYINLIFFNLYVIAGGVALYKLIKYYFNINQWILIITVFLLPSYLFWSSGIHKDGIIFTSIAISFYLFHSLIEKGFLKRKIVLLFVHILIIFLIRNYILLAIFPIFFAWIVAKKWNLNYAKIFLTTFVTCFLIFIFSSSFSLTKSISNSVVQKHHEFLLLEGNTKIETPLLENTTQSIIQYLPFAAKTMLFQPVAFESTSIFLTFTALENYAYLIIALISLFFISKQKINHPLILSCFMLTLFIYIFIGYTVCFGGAIVRYRSIILPFTILPYVLLIFGQIKPPSKDLI